MRSCASLFIAVMVGAGALSACVRHVDGSARRPYSVVSRLPTEQEMSAIAKNSLSKFGFQPFVGGLEVLPDGFRDDTEATPIACAGVTDTLLRIVYEKAPVAEAARQSYFNPNPGVEISGADVGIVRLASAGTASHLFAAMARDWRRCSNTTVVKQLGGAANNAELLATISSVAVTGSLLTAAVTTHDTRRRTTSRYARALGVRSDCIVEASVAVTPLAESGLVENSAAPDIVRLVQAKLGPK